MEKKAIKINLLVLFLILAIIIMLVMSYFIYQLSSEKEVAIKEIDNLNNKIDNLESTDINNKSVTNNKIEEDEELRTFLCNIAGFNIIKDLNSKITPDSNLFNVTLDDFRNGIKLDIASYFITSDERTSEGYIKYNKDDINIVFKELYNETIKDNLESDVSLLTYDKIIDGYRYKEAGDTDYTAYLVEIENQKYSNGIYEITFLYAYPNETDFIDNTIEQCDCYRTTVKVKLNENYKYSKYQLIDFTSMSSSLVGKVEEFR